jgi:hypothetical protein
MIGQRHDGVEWLGTPVVAKILFHKLNIADTKIGGCVACDPVKVWIELDPYHLIRQRSYMNGDEAGIAANVQGTFAIKNRVYHVLFESKLGRLGALYPKTVEPLVEISVCLPALPINGLISQMTAQAGLYGEMTTEKTIPEVQQRQPVFVGNSQQIFHVLTLANLKITE